MGFLGSAFLKKKKKPFGEVLLTTQLLFYANSILAPLRTTSLAPETSASKLDFAFPIRRPRNLRARAPCPPSASDARRRERGQLSARPPPAYSSVTGGRDPSRLRLITLRKSVKKYVPTVCPHILPKVPRSWETLPATPTGNRKWFLQSQRARR